MFGCRYNRLLETVHNSLQALLKALKGLVVMSQELENMANSLFINSVPSMWAGKVTDTFSYCRKLITSFKFWFDELLLCFSSNYRLIIIYRHVLNQIFLKLCRKKFDLLDMLYMFTVISLFWRVCLSSHTLINCVICYLQAYPSLKPLASWVVDLEARMKFITDWIENGMPSVSDSCTNCHGMRLTDFLLVCILHKFCKKTTMIHQHYRVILLF